MGAITGVREMASAYAGRRTGFKMTCPVCGYNGMGVREVEYFLPVIGKALLVSRSCPKCGYRRSEIIPLATGPRRRVYIRIDSREALRAKVVRLGTASIEIVELGVTIDPGVDAPTFVTNIEGLLSRVVDALRTIEVLAVDEREREKAREAREYLLRLDPGDVPLTIILDDRAGLSGVVESSKAWVLVESVEGELI